MRRGIALVIPLALAGCAPSGGPTVSAPPFVAGAAPKAMRSNAAMAADILDLAFALESGRQISALSRFEGPFRVRLAGDVPSTLPKDLSHLLGRLRDEAGLEIKKAEDGQAEIMIEAVTADAIRRAAPGAA